MSTPLKVLDQKIVENFPISKVTTLEIGGPAKYYKEVSSENELQETVAFAKKEGLSFLIIGGGSNLLVSDEGVEALVIKNNTDEIKLDGVTVTIASGTPLQKLVDFTISNALFGLHKLTGIPGTVGGAIYGNAGAYGQTISDFLVSCDCFDGQKKITLTKSECHFSYRDSDFKINNLTILSLTFRLPKANKEILVSESTYVLKSRMAKYQPGIKCPGSFFKNVLEEDLSPKILEMLPPRKDTYGKIPAWLFLELVGAKGQRLGDIQIAEFHANLFMNLGQGKAIDFWQLAHTYAEKVQEKFGIKLEPEVQLINLPPLDGK